MDDIRPPQQRGSRPPGHGKAEGDYNPPTQQYQPNATEQNYKVSEEQPAENYTLPANKKKSGKGKKFAIFLFVILFIASIAASVWLYLELQKSQDEVDSLNAQVKQLEVENYQLKYDTKDAAAKAILSSERYAELKDTSNQLKEACGDACSVIIIPEN